VDYETLGQSIGVLVDEKQRQYGDSANKSGEILRVLYPEGVKPHSYRDMLLMVRVLDKLSRIAQRGENGRDLGGESPWRDVAGYALLGIVADRDREALFRGACNPPQRKAVHPENTDCKRDTGCDNCSEPLGNSYFADVPKYGDLCSSCYGKIFPRRIESSFKIREHLAAQVRAGTYRRAVAAEKENALREEEKRTSADDGAMYVPEGSSR